MRWSYKLQLAIASDINGRSPLETFTDSVALIFLRLENSSKV